MTRRPAPSTELDTARAAWKEQVDRAWRMGAVSVIGRHALPKRALNTAELARRTAVFAAELDTVTIDTSNKTVLK